MSPLRHVILRPLAPRAAPALVTAALVTAALLLASAPSAGAQPAGAQAADPDWPCVQRLVPELAASQMWAGAPAAGAAGTNDTSIAPDDEAEMALAHRLAARSMPVDEARQAIERFAEGLAPEQRNAQLARLFGEVLQLINQERGEIIAGIKRYTRKQRRLADKIAQDSRQIGNLQPGTVPDAQTQDLLDVRQWDLRVYEDRQHVLRQICEQPVLMEQRAFALSRAMQAELAPR